LRRIIIYRKRFNLPNNFLIPLARKALEIYKEVYPEIKSKEADILVIIQKEEEKFEEALASGLNEATEVIAKGDVNGEDAFRLYQSYGFPLELIEEEAKKSGRKVDREGFYEHQKKHQEISRAGAEGKFGGVGREADYQSAKLHTATHLLHAALRKVLGNSVKQMGSDINQERLRFDFSHSQKMNAEEIKKVEEIVNEAIKEDLEVKKEEMKYEEAIESGALAFFKEKYPEKVSVYSAGNFSKEICAGPHVKRTSELGTFKIIKEESSSAGVRRIRATLS
jgi:alanyl-tRNA synthetase